MKTFPKPLTAREEREYLERYKEGDEEARSILIERNMRLVAHVIKNTRTQITTRRTFYRSAPSD